MIRVIRSMTGYGRSECQLGDKVYTWELRGVNHRYRDINVRVPRDYYFLEDKIRMAIADYVSRGRIDVYLHYDRVGTANRVVHCDKELAKAYYAALLELQDDLSLLEEVPSSWIASQPDVLTIQEVPEDMEELEQRLLGSLREACANLLAMREAEGQKLAVDLVQKTAEIDGLVSSIAERSPLVVEDYRQRLHERIKDLLNDVDIAEDRLAMEVAIFAERSSIDEELVRLRSHTEQFRAIVNEGGVVGRKLDFLVQEMNREINTIGSKANDHKISQLVVEVKAQLEKIREQVQNIE